MSYCRWSSDNFGCDLYCYQSDDGYVTHVAIIALSIAFVLQMVGATLIGGAQS